MKDLAGVEATILGEAAQGRRRYSSSRNTGIAAEHPQRNRGEARWAQKIRPLPPRVVHGHEEVEVVDPRNKLAKQLLPRRRGTPRGENPPHAPSAAPVPTGRDGAGGEPSRSSCLRRTAPCSSF